MNESKSRIRKKTIMQSCSNFYYLKFIYFKKELVTGYLFFCLFKIQVVQLQYVCKRCHLNLRNQLLNKMAL